MPDSVPPRPTVAALTMRIERDINLGVLGMGAWLKQVDLEAQYACSRLDLRQALDRLVERGLVRHIANRGYCVEAMDPVRIDELRAIRGILEAAAAEMVLGSIDELGLSSMHEAAERFQAAVEDGTTLEQEEENTLFHSRMLAFCTNREMVGMIFELRRRVPLAMARQRNTTALLRRKAAEHFEIVALLRARKLPHLERLMRQHVSGVES